ncbi:UNVERIFIED_CONTAM: hypothetical protein FKN15_020928 [Acipenser sinensis]
MKYPLTEQVILPFEHVNFCLFYRRPGQETPQTRMQHLGPFSSCGPHGLVSGAISQQGLERVAASTG